MDKKELEIYKQVVKEKYKYYTLWKILAIVFICLTIILAVLFFTDVKVVKETTKINNNEIEVINEGDNETNNIYVSNGW